MATMRLISSTPEAYHRSTYHFYRGDVGAMLPPKICYNQSINIFIAYSKLSIIIYYILQKTGLLNFPQGSYKFYVGSPPGSHLSKLVATPDHIDSVVCIHSVSGYKSLGQPMTIAVASLISADQWEAGTHALFGVGLE